MVADASLSKLATRVRFPSPARLQAFVSVSGSGLPRGRGVVVNVRCQAEGVVDARGVRDDGLLRDPQQPGDARVAAARRDQREYFARHARELHDGPGAVAGRAERLWQIRRLGMFWLNFRRHRRSPRP